MNMTTGQFWMTTGLGLVAGTAIGMTLAPSKREIKRAAHKAIKNVNQAVSEAVDNISEVMGM